MTTEQIKTCGMTKEVLREMFITLTLISEKKKDLKSIMKFPLEKAKKEEQIKSKQRKQQTQKVIN